MDYKQVNAVQVVREMCREIILCLGGVFAVHEVPDDVVWQIAKSLDQIFQKALSKARLEKNVLDNGIPEKKYQPHPAIQHVLGRLQANHPEEGEE